MITKLFVVVVLLCCSAVLNAQEVSRPASPFVISSRDNLVPFTPDQLSQLGYSRRVEGARVYWFRPVTDGRSSCDPALSRPGATERGLCESCRSLHSGAG